MAMTKTTKTLLYLALAGLLLGLLFSSGGVKSDGLVVVYLLLPMGAIFFGLFLLSKVLEKETAMYDEEQRANLALAARQKGEAQPPRAGSPSQQPETP